MRTKATTAKKKLTPKEKALNGLTRTIAKIDKLIALKEKLNKPKKFKKPLLYIHLPNTYKPFLPEDLQNALREKFSKLFEPKQHPAI